MGGVSVFGGEYGRCCGVVRTCVCVCELSLHVSAASAMLASAGILDSWDFFLWDFLGNAEVNKGKHCCFANRSVGCMDEENQVWATGRGGGIDTREERSLTAMGVSTTVSYALTRTGGSWNSA